MSAEKDDFRCCYCEGGTAKAICSECAIKVVEVYDAGYIQGYVKSLKEAERFRDAYRKELAKHPTSDMIKQSITTMNSFIVRLEEMINK